MEIIFIVAVDKKRHIGKDGKLPWGRLPRDMDHFRMLTMGKPIIMGRKTFESIGKALPGRRNVVLTHDNDFRAIGCDIVHSVDEALALLKDEEEIMIVGGAAIYKAFISKADRMYITEVAGIFEGDTKFPAFYKRIWREVSRVRYDADEDNSFTMSFVTWERKRKLKQRWH